MRSVNGIIQSVARFDAEHVRTRHPDPNIRIEEPGRRGSVKEFDRVAFTRLSALYRHAKHASRCSFVESVYAVDSVHNLTHSSESFRDTAPYSRIGLLVHETITCVYYFIIEILGFVHVGGKIGAVILEIRLIFTSHKICFSSGADRYTNNSEPCVWLSPRYLYVFRFPFTSPEGVSKLLYIRASSSASFGASLGSGYCSAPMLHC